MADPLLLDLDTLDPRPGTVKLHGKEFTVYPPSVGQIVKLTKVAKSLDDFTDTKVDGVSAIELVEKLLDVLDPIIPGIKDDKVQLNMAQAGALMRFVFSLASPKETEALRAEGIDPVTTEKKIPNVS